MKRFGPLLSGVLFGLGLVLSGMTDPARVLAFLDVAGDWDPTLAFVMGAALGVYALLARMIARRPRPLVTSAFELPAAQVIDARLLLGAAIFGVGWGLSGFCPAPALVATGAGGLQALVFVPAMLAGMLLYRTIDRRLDKEGAGDQARIADVSDA